MSIESELLDRITVRAEVFGGKADHPGHADRRRACARDAGGGRHGGDDPAGVPGTGARRHSGLPAIRTSFSGGRAHAMTGFRFEVEVAASDRDDGGSLARDEHGDPEEPEVRA